MPGRIAGAVVKIAVARAGRPVLDGILVRWSPGRGRASDGRAMTTDADALFQMTSAFVPRACPLRRADLWAERVGKFRCFPRCRVQPRRRAVRFGDAGYPCG